MPNEQPVSCQIIGAGPAGMGIIVALYNAIAARSGEWLERLEYLRDTLVMIEGEFMPGGVLGEYRINANTHAADAVAALADNTPFAEFRDTYLKLPEIERVLISLPRLDEVVVKPLANQISTLLGERLHCSRKVERFTLDRDVFTSFDNAGRLIARSRTLVTCCGGEETILPELEPWRTKTEFGGLFMRRQGVDGLPEKSGPVVITSASHSGFSCVWRLLYDPLFKAFARGRDIVILQRRSQVKLRCEKEYAIENKIKWDEQTDVCPKTGKVFSSGGLRKDAKYLYLKIRDGEEKRARLLAIERIADCGELLDSAALVIQCAGFVAKFPQFEINGRIRQLRNRSKDGAVSDGETGEIIPGLFACGLGMHVDPPENYRGEKSFNGSINGLQSYPLAIAPRIIQQLVNCQQESA